MLPYYFSVTDICPEILELIVEQLNIERDYAERAEFTTLLKL